MKSLRILNTLPGTTLNFSSLYITNTFVSETLTNLEFLKTLIIDDVQISNVKSVENMQIYLFSLD